MRIDVWADIVCPFCYLGKRHLELALAEFEHADEVDLHWHSFQLDPALPAIASAPLPQTFAEKFGVPLAEAEQSQRQVAAQAERVGLRFNWEDARYGNTFDAHRLVHLAADHGLATEALTRIMRAYFVEGVQIGDPTQLERLGQEIGLDIEDLREMLAGDRYADAVRSDEDDARRMGIQGVPFFVFNDEYAVSGAQPVATMTQVLDRVWGESSTSPDDEQGPTWEAGK